MCGYTLCKTRSPWSSRVLFSLVLSDFLLAAYVQILDPNTLNNPLLIGVNGRLEGTFQAAWYIYGVKPDPPEINLLFVWGGSKKGGPDRLLDLIIVKSKQVITSYELKVSKKSVLELNNLIRQAQRNAKVYNTTYEMRS